MPTPLVAASTPSAPGAPAKVTSTLSTITIQWTASTANGGSAITNYAVKINNGLGGGYVFSGNSGSGSTLTYTQTGLIPGQLYYFIINAINIVGTGADSVATGIIAGTVPQ